MSENSSPRFYRLQKEYGCTPIRYIGPQLLLGVLREATEKEWSDPYTYLWRPQTQEQSDAALQLRLAVARGEADPPVVPMPFRTYSGGKLRDCIAGIDGDFAFAVVTDRFLRCLEANAVTGFSAVPATIQRGKKLLTGYWALRIHGKCGPTRYDKPRIELRDGKRVKVGIYFDLETWDGSDLFNDDWDFPNLMCTERVKMIIEESGLDECCRFQALDEFEHVSPIDS